MKLFSFATFLLLASISSLAFAKYNPKTLQQAIEQISPRDDDAEQQALALLSSVQEQQQGALTAQALLFVMKIQRQKKHLDGVKSNYLKLERIVEKNQLYKTHAEGLLLLAKSERMQDNNDQALKIIEEQILPLAKAHAPELLGNIYTEAANNVALIPDVEKVEYYFQLAIETLKAEKQFKKSARVQAIKATHLSSYGKIQAALPALRLAIKEQLALNDKDGLFLSYNAFGTLNHEIGNYQQAMVYFRKSQALGHESPRSLASLNYKMAFTSYELQQYDEGLRYIEQAISYLQHNASKKDLVTVLLGKVMLFIKLQNYSASLETLNKVTALAKGVNSNRIHEDLQTSFANYYLAVGDTQSALKSIEAALAFETSHKAMIIEKYKTASEIYEAAGDYAKSLFYLRKLREVEQKKAKIKDEQRVFQQQNEINLLNEQKNTALVQQQLLAKQNQVQLQQAEQQRLWFYAGILLFCLIALFSFSYLRQSQKKRIALEQSKLVMAVMEQKNHFIANVVHDLKNPIAVIQVHLEALKDGMIKNPDKAHDILALRLAELTTSIDDLRQVSLLEIGSLRLTPEPLSFKVWLQQEINAFRPLVESKGLSLKTALRLDKSVEVIADPGRLSQVFANIIKNSLRYSHQPGKLTIIAEQHGQSIELMIKDSTPAVAESELNNLFVQGYRSKNTEAMSTKGSGLGLYICREIIEAHQGSISASLSNLGGLAIKIKMPLVDKQI